MSSENKDHNNAEEVVGVASLGVRDLKALAKSMGVSVAGVCEKGELVSRVKAALGNGDSDFVSVSRVSAAKAKTKASSSTQESKPQSAAASSSAAASRRDAPSMGAAPDFSKLTPAQLKYQAACMRNNPDMVRRSNPHLSALTNEQLREAAKHMEMMADNPEMRQKTAEVMSNMTPDQLKKMQEMQSKLTPEQMGAMKIASQGGTLTDAQMDSLISLLKTNGDVLKDLAKAYMPNASDEQIESQIKALQGANPAHLKMALKSANVLAKVGKPAAKVYKKVDKVTGGYAKYIAIAIVLILLYIIAVYSWAILKWVYAWAFSSTAASGAASPPLPSQEVKQEPVLFADADNEDEFAF